MKKKDEEKKKKYKWNDAKLSTLFDLHCILRGNFSLFITSRISRFYWSMMNLIDGARCIALLCCLLEALRQFRCSFFSFNSTHQLHIWVLAFLLETLCQVIVWLPTRIASNEKQNTSEAVKRENWWIELRSRSLSLWITKPKDIGMEVNGSL